MMGLPGRERSLTMSLVVWLQCTNVTDRQTDGRTDTRRQLVLRLRLASRGKKWLGLNINLIMKFIRIKAVHVEV